MEKDNSSQEFQFIQCPQCEGKGKDNESYCSTCANYGVGTFYRDRFLYWGVRLTASNITLRRGKKTLDLFIDVAAYVVGLLGIAALVWWIWQNSSADIEKLLFFWRAQHWLILSFWIGILAWLFIIYRKWKEVLERRRISVWKPLPNISLPNNWEELRNYGNTKEAYSTYSEKATRRVEDAFLLAKKKGHAEVKPVHILLSLLRDNTIRGLFVRLNVDGKELKTKLQRQLEEQEPAEKGKKPIISKEVKEALTEAVIKSYEHNQLEVRPLNIIGYVVTKSETLKEVLLDLEMDTGKIRNVVEWFKIDEQLRQRHSQYQKMAQFKPKTKMDRAYTAVATPILDQFGYDLTLAAKSGRAELCVERQKEMDQIFETLTAGNNGVLLTGPEGIGKKTIIQGLARAMVKEQVPEFMQDKRLVEVDVARLISGANPAEAEKRLLQALDEVLQAQNILLYIRNIENIIGISPGEEQSMELSEVLADALDRYNVFCFATATDNNYTQYIEENALGKKMARVKIKEPSGDQAIRIVESKIGGMEAKFGVFYTYNAIEEAIKLSSQYIHDRHQPTKALQVLEKSGASTAQQCGKKKICMCTKEEVRKEIQEMTDIPAEKVGEEEGEELLNLEEEIHKHLINQEEAVEVVANSLRRARAELREKTRTIANFLFLGPTGVGKTELTKTVAKIYFGSKDYMIRLDMSEYQHQDSVKKLIGDKDTKGTLTEKIREQPYALILLDEFEKAHPQILTLFLQVMDDGRLTDGQGKTVDFNNSMIIATSNAASDFIQQKIKEDMDTEDLKEKVINEKLSTEMPPELINRFDGVIVFKPLSQEHIVEVTKLILEDTRHMLDNKGINLRISQEGAEKLAQEGFDPKFGARPIQRVVQKKVNNIIAKKILANEIKRRDTVIINDDAELEIEKGKEL